MNKPVEPTGKLALAALQAAEQAEAGPWPPKWTYPPMSLAKEVWKILEPARKYVQNVTGEVLVFDKEMSAKDLIVLTRYAVMKISANTNSPTTKQKTGKI